MKVVCLSDTHDLHNDVQVPDGDILIHAGDITTNGAREAISNFNNWLGKLPHKYKIVTAGNHDYFAESHPLELKELLSNAIYLCNESVEIEGVKIWASPHSPISPKFGDDGAFVARRGMEIKKQWLLIPADTDILVTHCPPLGILDKNESGSNEGCDELLNIVQNQVKPRLHIFGHIHHAHGQVRVEQTVYVNASIADLQGWLVDNKVISAARKLVVSLGFFRYANRVRKLLGVSKQVLHKSASSVHLRAKNQPIVIEL